MDKKKDKLFWGIDGCRAGWFAVCVSRGGDFVDFCLKDSFKKVVEFVTNAAITLVDIPVGLKEKGTSERKCDLMARKFVGRKRAGSIFRAPAEKTLESRNYRSACRVNHALTGKGISIQCWNIIKKIKEVQIVLSERRELQKFIRETHPEVCFCALNKRKKLIYSKKNREGFQERLSIISKYNKNALDFYLEMRKHFPKTFLQDDDILDAMVMALSAWKCYTKGVRALPTESESECEYDSSGLKMEIVYPDICILVK